MDQFVSAFSAASASMEALMVRLGLDFAPSSYAFLFPPDSENFKIADVDHLASQGIFPSFKSLAPAFVCCALFSLFRFVFHHLFFKRLAYSAMNIKSEHLVPNRDLDKNLPSINKKKPADAKVLEYCQRNKLNSHDVNSYLRLRYKNECNERSVSKFVEAFWRCLFYTVFVIAAFYTFLNPPLSWVQDLKGCWDEWPFHAVIPALLTYHHVQLGCYLHQLLWTEVSRSDAFEMILHHVVTIFLVTTSYVINLQRIGSIIMVVHDLADIFLESAKLFNYVATKNDKYKGIAKTLSDILFVIFAVAFFITRLVIFPFWVLNSVIFHGFDWMDNTYLGGKIIAIALTLLQLLHIFWFYTIMKMAYKLVTTGIEGDERSDDEEGNAIASKSSVKSE